MNAVNLIPLERRHAGAPRLPGAPFVGLFAALVLALGGTVAYVEVHNTVTSRQSELSHLRTGTAEWSAAAARYTPAISALSGRVKGFAQLGVLLGQRYDWSVLLGQIAGVMPAHAQLASLSASTPAPASTTPSSGGASTSSGGTATTSGATATTSGATATTSTAATAPTGGTSDTSAITITACAVSEPVVADTMVALRRLSGVSAVSLLSSSQAGSAAAGSSTCKLPVQFNLTLQFAPGMALLRLPDVARAGSSGQTSATAQLASSTQPTGATR